MKGLAAADAVPKTAMIDATYLKAHHTASSKQVERTARPVGKRFVSAVLISLRKRIRPFDERSPAKMDKETFRPHVISSVTLEVPQSPGNLQTMRFPTSRHVIAWLLLVVAAPLPSTGATVRSWRFDIPRLGAAAGIAAFSRQATTVQILVAQDAIRGRRTNRLQGNYSAETALTTLLRGSGLRWLRTGPTTYSLILTAKGYPK